MLLLTFLIIFINLHEIFWIKLKLAELIMKSSLGDHMTYRKWCLLDHTGSILSTLFRTL